MAMIGAFCPYCGAKALPGARFCEGCGASLGEQRSIHHPSKEVVGMAGSVLDLRQVGEIAKDYVTRKENPIKDTLKITSSKLQSVGTLAVFVVRGTYKKGNILQMKEYTFTLQVGAEDGSVVGEEFYG